MCYNIHAESPLRGAGRSAAAKSGQAALEYLLAALAVLAVASVVAFVALAARRSAARTQVLVGSEYP